VESCDSTYNRGGGVHCGELDENIRSILDGKDTDIPIIRGATIARLINGKFFTPAEMQASLQLLCAAHNGGKERERHAEANRKKIEKRQTPQENILGEIAAFKARKDEELIACCPLMRRTESTLVACSRRPARTTSATTVPPPSSSIWQMGRVELAVNRRER